jgi:plasmid stability protein
MPTLTIKNIPRRTYERLKKQAHIHHRSINSHVIHSLESVMEPQHATAESMLQQIARIRNRLAVSPLTGKYISAAKNEGRL